MSQRMNLVNCELKFESKVTEIDSSKLSKESVVKSSTESPLTPITNITRELERSVLSAAPDICIEPEIKHSSDCSQTFERLRTILATGYGSSNKSYRK
ncbi:hypothetical protein TKK_0012557 [Trichogramma kaykai]